MNYRNNKYSLFGGEGEGDITERATMMKEGLIKARKAQLNVKGASAIAAILLIACVVI